MEKPTVVGTNPVTGVQLYTRNELEAQVHDRLIDLWNMIWVIEPDYCSYHRNHINKGEVLAIIEDYTKDLY